MFGPSWLTRQAQEPVRAMFSRYESHRASS